MKFDFVEIRIIQKSRQNKIRRRLPIDRGNSCDEERSYVLKKRDRRKDREEFLCNEKKKKREMKKWKKGGLSMQLKYTKSGVVYPLRFPWRSFFIQKLRFDFCDGYYSHIWKPNFIFHHVEIFSTDSQHYNCQQQLKRRLNNNFLSVGRY